MTDPIRIQERVSDEDLAGITGEFEAIRAEYRRRGAPGEILVPVALEDCQHVAAALEELRDIRAAADGLDARTDSDPGIGSPPWVIVGDYQEDGSVNLAASTLPNGTKLYVRTSELGSRSLPAPTRVVAAHVSVGLTQKESQVLRAMAARQDMSSEAVLRQALRIYQLIKETPGALEAVQKLRPRLAGGGCLGDD